MGLDRNGDKVDLAVHLQRGANLRELTDAWLRTWEDPVDGRCLMSLCVIGSLLSACVLVIQISLVLRLSPNCRYGVYAEMLGIGKTVK